MGPDPEYFSTPGRFRTRFNPVYFSDVGYPSVLVSGGRLSYDAYMALPADERFNIDAYGDYMSLRGGSGGFPPNYDEWRAENVGSGSAIADPLPAPPAMFPPANVPHDPYDIRDN